MKSESWEKQFEAVYRRGEEAWKGGKRSPHSMFSATDVEYLKTIGCSAQELFDFVDDSLRYGDFDFQTVLEVQRVRRDYFLDVLGGKPATQIVPMSRLPAKTDAVDGIAWLPRLIVKARLKLRGEMPDDLMYGCGGDRPFLRKMGMTLSEFLELVRDSGDNDRKIIDAVKASAARR